MDDWLVSVVKDGKVIELYYSRELNDLDTIRAMHRGCGVEVIELRRRTQVVAPEIVLPDRKLSRNGRPWANRVQCVETGEIWSSVVECSKSTGIPQWGIYKSIRKGCRSFGRYFVLLPPGEPTDE